MCEQIGALSKLDSGIHCNDQKERRDDDDDDDDRDGAEAFANRQADSGLNSRTKGKPSGIVVLYGRDLILQQFDTD